MFPTLCLNNVWVALVVSVLPRVTVFFFARKQKILKKILLLIFIDDDIRFS